MQGEVNNYRRTKMNHKEALQTAAGLISERGKEYGPEDACFERSAQLASIVLNKSISKYDVAMILGLNKMARLQESRTKEDHYVDAINYLAFAVQFAEQPESIETAVEDDIKMMATRLSPNYFDRKDNA
jgi:hypothetical protein